MKTFYLSVLLLLSHIVNADLLPQWKAGIGIGSSKQSETKNYIYFQTPLFDALKSKHQNHYPAFTLNLQHKLLEKPHYYIYLGTHVYYLHNQWTGEVWGLDMPVFNNFNYRKSIKSTSAMAELEYTATFLNAPIQPFASIGFGMAANQISYQEQATGAYPFTDAIHQTKNTVKAAFNTGAGIRLAITEQHAIGFRYLYQHNGSSDFTRNSSHQNWQNHSLWLTLSTTPARAS